MAGNSFDVLGWFIICPMSAKDTDDRVELYETIDVRELVCEKVTVSQPGKPKENLKVNL